MFGWISRHYALAAVLAVLKLDSSGESAGKHVPVGFGAMGVTQYQLFLADGSGPLPWRDGSASISSYIFDLLEVTSPLSVRSRNQ